MLFLTKSFVCAVLALASLSQALNKQDFAFSAIKPNAAAKRPNHVQVGGESHHGISSHSLRSYQLIERGRFRSLKMTAGDFKAKQEELVFLDVVQEVAPEDNYVEEVVVVVEETHGDASSLQETEENFVQNVIDTVRDAYDTYISPNLGGAVDAINSAARDALAWISGIWGSKALSKVQSSVLTRLALLQVDNVTGNALILTAPNVNVKVVRVGKVVFDSEASILAKQTIGDSLEIAVSNFDFEVGDIIVTGNQDWWKSLPEEQVLQTLSTRDNLAVKANNIVKLAPKTQQEYRFALGYFE